MQSGVKPGFLPLILFSRKEKAIMEPVRAVHPELDSFGVHFKASPVRWARNIPWVALIKFLDLRFKLFTTCQNPALL